MKHAALESSASFQEALFVDLQCAGAEIRASEFDGCKFQSCDFSSAVFTTCRFRDCDFQECNFNVAEFRRSRMQLSQFRGCKLAGVNWTLMDWRGFALDPPLSFVRCDLSYGVFSELDLTQLIMHECSACEADFVGTDLTGADFDQTDFAGARFHRTKLDQCQFQQAYNFAIDPTQNSLSNARFSSPEVFNLLAPFKIKIDDDGSPS